MAIQVRDQLNKFKETISARKSETDVKAFINQWINGTYGKIIGWKLRTKEREENFHLIITKTDIQLNVGEYPAFDFMMIGSPETVTAILSGNLRINSELKQGRLMVWGNLNEGLLFEKFIQKILKK